MKVQKIWGAIVVFAFVSQLLLNVFFASQWVSLLHLNEASFVLLCALMVFSVLVLVAFTYAVYVIWSELCLLKRQLAAAHNELLRMHVQPEVKLKDQSSKVNDVSRRLLKNKTQLVNGYGE